MIPFYNPEKSYEDNLTEGPYGVFSDSLVMEMEGEPKYNFFSYKVYSPFGIPAGPLINGKFVEAALDKGFDIVTYKTVRTRKYPCHPWPNVLSLEIEGNLSLEKAQGKLIADSNYKEPLSITNSFGVPSTEPEFWQKEIKELVKKTRGGQIIIGSFQGTKKEGQSVDDYIKDFCLAAKLLKETGVHVLEVNLSCPNEGTVDLLCYDTERSIQVVKSIKNEIREIPLIIKIAYFENDDILFYFVKEIGSIVQGISAINTISATIVDKNGEQILPGEGRSRGGVCGSAIKWAGLDMVKRLKNIRKKLGYSFTIIGVGGVMNFDDFIEYRNNGADIVMSATGSMWNPYLARDIKEKLE
ncbi:dihydroorotate oxidase [Candidatus Nomurabacteria bacterium CG_4_9_14_0_2_um_filter_32_10]|uniref:Dihydroorotate oxidase n=3 Tax=Candidatus Nomuraibacteriota TaxID=1752729 RepID=A0A2H0CHA1_9BACT|nr:MAG: dihydroorotate oxidase [Candidatus Nomurabacteria bacterium CG22_combo_CG10-13_8_21_14_all_32_8]PIZ85905.1 MAG: dihydroorotate oxidase [Candidatus Nomurabacteria bacterium CG_4_10_14_0_2_um_filter_33_9]PJC49346.1 MAG: dihydroorotate oxidase [Candidatus Nomurabacteria bacterium CG_4_9_14_0_2_um_filter_32_10]